MDIAVSPSCVGRVVGSTVQGFPWSVVHCHLSSPGFELVGEPVYEEGSLGADLSAALKGDKDQSDLLEQLKQETGKASSESAHDEGRTMYHVALASAL